jgi:hypothetical protein
MSKLSAQGRWPGYAQPPNSACRLACDSLVVPVVRRGTGWSARASLSATLTIELVNGALVPRVRPRPAEVDLNIDTWVEALGALFAAPLLIAAEAFLADAERMFKRLIDQAIGDALKGVAEQIQATLNMAVLSVGLDNSRLTGIAINPYGIFVQMQVTTPPATDLNPILGISVDENVVDLEVARSGMQTGITCNTNASYAYQDQHRWTKITLTAMPQALGDQVTYQWTINGEAVGPDRSEQFIPTRTYDGSELPTPGRIQRILNPTGVQLTINHSPPEGNLNLLVQCVARNTAGRQATTNPPSRGQSICTSANTRAVPEVAGSPTCSARAQRRKVPVMPHSTLCHSPGRVR